MTKSAAPTAGPPPPEEGEQGEVFAFLADPRAHAGGGPVKRIDTQGAAVFLAGDDAYKALRAIRLPFLDFSTGAAPPAKRKSPPIATTRPESISA